MLLIDSETVTVWPAFWEWTRKNSSAEENRAELGDSAKQEHERRAPIIQGLQARKNRIEKKGVAQDDHLSQNGRNLVLDSQIKRFELAAPRNALCTPLGSTTCQPYFQSGVAVATIALIFSANYPMSINASIIVSRPKHEASCRCAQLGLPGIRS